jgi:hypothetical protein
MKYTKKHLIALVEKLNIELGNPVYYMDKDKNILVDHIHLDHNSFYGGYQLQQTSNENGGVDDRILGLSWGHRLKVNEMGLYLDGLLKGIEVAGMIEYGHDYKKVG